MAFACLSFDFDMFSPWIIGGDTSPTPLSRGEYGRHGAERVLSLLRKNNIRSTWFVPGHTIESFPELSKRVHEDGHEIGHHGYMHEPPHRLDRAAEAAVLDRGISCIKALTGEAPKGYRSPSWDLSPNSVELLIEKGLEYDSSMMAGDHRPYRCRIGDRIDMNGPFVFGQPTDLWEMPVSWSLDDFPLFEYLRTPYSQPGNMPASNALENWVADFQYLTREDPTGMLIYTMHPDVIGRGHRMLMLEALIDKLRSLGAEFVTMHEALLRTR